MLLRAAGLGFAALVVATALAALAPAHAASVASCRGDRVMLSNGQSISTIDARATMIVMQLRQRGYDVDSVEDWGGCVKATIRDPNGGSHMGFFDQDSLEPLTP